MTTSKPEPEPEQGSSSEQPKLTRDQWVAMRDSDSLRIAEKVRGLALGVLGFSWVIVSADKGIAAQINTAHHRWIYATGCLAVLALLFDLLHTLLHFVQVQAGVEELMKNEEASPVFNYDSKMYKSQPVFFWAKVSLSIGACVSLVVLLAINML